MQNSLFLHTAAPKPKAAKPHQAWNMLDMGIKNYIDRSSCRLIFSEGKAMA